MSFASPKRKSVDESSKGPINSLSLLTYMLYREKHKDSVALLSHREHGNLLLSKDQFSILEILGKGGFGKVYKVQFKKNGNTYAMKEMSKAVYMSPNAAF